MHMGCVSSHIRIRLMAPGIRADEHARVQTQRLSVETTAASVAQKAQIPKALVGLICFHLRSLVKACAELLQPLHVLAQIAFGRNPQRTGDRSL